MFTSIAEFITAAIPRHQNDVTKRNKIHVQRWAASEPTVAYLPTGGNGIDPKWGPNQLSSLAKCIAPAVTRRSLVTDHELPSQVISSAGTGSFPTFAGGGVSIGW